MIGCENNLCTYQKYNECILDVISLGGGGVCQDCINVTIDEQQLNSIKERILKNFDELCDYLESR